MTTQELRELDAWIAEHVFGWKKWNFDNGFSKYNYLNPTNERANNFRKRGWIEGLSVLHQESPYTTNPAAAMEVLKKCAGNSPGITISFYGKDWVVGSEWAIHPSKAETLELAICLFAKELFSK